MGLGKEAVDGFESLRPVEIVGVDDGKGRVDVRRGGQRRVARAPGLHPLLRHGEALRQLRVQSLIGQFHFQPLHRMQGGAEGLGVGRVDDANRPSEARPGRVEQGIVHDDPTVAVHRVDLLQAAVPAAQARGHDHQDGIVVHICLLCR